MNQLSQTGPRVSTRDIYRLFGYAEHRALKAVIASHLEDFDIFGELRKTSTLLDGVGTGGRPSEYYLLNLDHLMLLSCLVRNRKGSPKKDIALKLIEAYKSASLKSIYSLLSSIDVKDLPEDRYVYVAQEEVSGRYKIGISKDPERRVKELNIGNPEGLKLVHAYLATEEGYQSEIIAHKIFEDSRLRSEWFGGDIKLNKLPSYRAAHEDRTEEPFCDCVDCAIYDQGYDVVLMMDGVPSKSEAAVQIKKKTKLTDKMISDVLEKMFDLGVVK